MADLKHPELEDLLREDRAFAPPADFQARAHVGDQSMYAEAERDPEAFWARLAGELEWARPWDRILDWRPPHAKWFVGGKLNARDGVADGRSTKDIANELKEHVVKKIGAIARPDDILFTPDLPKTRSGKIMRRLLRDIAEGKALGDMTTLADSAAVEKLKANYEEEYG